MKAAAIELSAGLADSSPGHHLLPQHSVTAWITLGGGTWNPHHFQFCEVSASSEASPPSRKDSLNSEEITTCHSVLPSLLIDSNPRIVTSFIVQQHKTTWCVKEGCGPSLRKSLRTATVAATATDRVVSYLLVLSPQFKTFVHVYAFFYKFAFFW